MPAPSIPNLLNCGICKLRPVNLHNVQFVEDLFRFNDIRKFYVLRDDHASNIRRFGQYIIESNRRQESMNFIIFDNNEIKVGFISAVPIMNRETDMPMWNVGYAIHPSFRRNGYASASLSTLSNFLLQNYTFLHVMLDICSQNIESEKVAKKCGFIKPDNRQGCIDPNHMELGVRFRWFKQLEGKRTIYFNQAAHYYRLKDYQNSLTAFRQALKEPYQPGTPYTDAQIYSNMGMALSSLHLYREAFKALKKAQSLGLNNPSIERELLWLRNNKGIY